MSSFPSLLFYCNFDDGLTFILDERDVHNLRHPSRVAVGDSRSEAIHLPLEDGEPTGYLLSRAYKEMGFVVKDLWESNPGRNG